MIKCSQTGLRKVVLTTDKKKHVDVFFVLNEGPIGAPASPRNMVIVQLPSAQLSTMAGGDGTHKGAMQTFDCTMDAWHMI